MADGKVVISTALDNSGIEKDASQLKNIVGKTVKGTLGGLTKVSAGVSASIVAAFGVAAITIAKQASDAYADYEQLIGGVETLFRDSADKVVEYAEDAFYTVGISANEYMETVTSFSAGLISALAGDTAKAADVADMALTDMADNANKMGTPLESIKNAYQGFAKQNYTMLDNLKLGYGGTKTEMERLLADAQKLTGVKYNINNLADVYNAIHTIQVEMGIAGTTAREAEKTITGSANMTKAAWKNVLVAISGGGDIDKAINSLVYSVSKYFDNIVPVVERSLAGIGELIEKIAPQLVETVAAALIKAIPSLLNAVYQMIIGLASGIYKGIVALFSGSTKEITAQFNAASSLADGYNAAADGASNLASETEKAGKAAKKYLAPFDEITKLGSKDSDSAPSGSVSTGNIGGSVTLGGEVKDELTPKVEGIFQAIAEKFRELIAAYAPSFKAWSDAFDVIVPAAKNAAGRVGKAFSNLWKYNLKPLADYIGRDWAPSITNSWNKTIAPIFKDTMPVLLEEATEDFELFCAASSEALDGLKGTMQNVETGFEDMCDSFSSNWNEYGDGILTGFAKFKDGLRETFVTLYEGIIKPVFGYMSETFSSLWKNHLKPLWDNIVEFGLSVGENVLALWNGYLKPMVDHITAFLAPAITGAINLIVGWISFAAGLIADVAGGIITILDGVIQFVVGVFTLDWERAWGGIVKLFDGLFNGVIVGTVKGGVNNVIWMFNALIAAIYAAIAGVINGVGSIVESFGDLIGQDWGFSVPANPPQIPYLAKGTVLPPNKPFMAVVGDQTHGMNIEAPLSTIEEAVANVMGDMLPAMIAGFERVVEEQQATRKAVESIEVGDSVIGPAANRYNAKMATIRGGVT